MWLYKFQATVTSRGPAEPLRSPLRDWGPQFENYCYRLKSSEKFVYHVQIVIKRYQIFKSIFCVLNTIPNGIKYI